MKKYIKNTFAALSLMAVATSCGDFGDTNIDPEHLNEGNVPYVMVFTNAQHQALGSDWDVWRNGLIYLSQWNQHIAAGGWWWSYGINAYENSYTASYWGSVLSGGDRGAIRDIQTVIAQWKDNPAMEQNYQIARIVRAYIFHRLTDLHGDIPYSQAGQPKEFSYPKYDKQEDIYNDLLKELDEAQANLGSGTASMGAQDLYYNGDVSKWKKFANSLMLRVAMRLTKVNAAKAQEYAAKAYSNGVITETADNCRLNHAGGVTTNDSSEPYAKIIIHEDPGVAYINKTFIDALTSMNDPRIPLIMAVYPDTYEAKDVDPADPALSAPERQKGLIGFFSMGPTSSYSIKKYYPEEYTDEVLSNTASPNYYKKTHSQPNRSTYGDPTGPTFVCTAAQTNLLLAEAAYRGWINGSAESFYNAGVRCAMEQFSQYPSANAKTLYNTYLTSSAVNDYLTANAYNSSKALEQINTQYWITCFFDEYETYANWRRSGYPELKERGSAHDNWSDLGQYGPDIVRRFPYPSSELQINSTNYLEALGRMGLTNENDFNNTRVWWDAK
ncbi:SusD/RagB family nutrient-binding outer membrane lipoprotein [Phocaeicola sp.]